MRWSSLKEVLEKIADPFSGLVRGGMCGPVMHPDAILRPKQSVNLANMVQKCPAAWGIFAAAGHEERPGSHQRLQLVEVMPLLPEQLIRARYGV